MSIEDTIGTLVRDACSVVPVPKSQYRKRLQRLVLSAQREVLEEFTDLQDYADGTHFKKCTICGEPSHRCLCDQALMFVERMATKRLATIEAELKEAA